MTSDVQSNPWRQRTFLDRTSVTVWLVSALPQWPGIVVRLHCASHKAVKLNLGEKCWEISLSQTVLWLWQRCFHSNLGLYSLIHDVCLKKSKVLALCIDKGHTFFSMVTYCRTAAQVQSRLHKCVMPVDYLELSASRFASVSASDYYSPSNLL